MARRSGKAEEHILARGMILQLLQAAVNRERGDKESFSTYVDEDLVYMKVGRRYPQTRETLRGHLYYLRDKGYARFHEVTVGREKSLMWRITADGTDLLDGIKTDPGVCIE